MYYSDYKAQQCQENIRRFIKAAKEAGYDFSYAKVIVLRNKGISALGQVNARFARSSNMNISPRERNWRFHVFLERDGLIYDFDYSNQPQILSVKDYFEKMFFNPKGINRFKITKEEKLNEYTIELYNAYEYLKRQENLLKKISLFSYLEE